MRFSILAVLLVATLADAQFNAMLALLKTFKLTAPLECAMPCILESANKLPCDGAGPASTICNKIEWIAEDTRGCTEKCNSDKANTFAVELARWVCGHGQKAKESAGAEASEESGEGEVVKEL